MRKPMAKKVLAASMAAAMTMSVAACGGKTPAPAPASTPEASTEVSASTEAPVEEVSKYTVLKDADGNVYDLGGIEVYIRDWWSSDEREEAKTDYEEALYDYRDWIQETYNFKVHTVSMGDWGSCAQDFVDYVTAGGDDTNYVWTIWSGNGTLLNAIKSGLVYDLSTLDCLDFTDKKYTDNNAHALYTLGGGTYVMHTGPAEPRTGVYFNKSILTEVGIDPESIYDMQANGTWTWDAWEEMLQKCMIDRDGDGEIDVYGTTCNDGVMTSAAVFSNGGQYVGMDADGNYTYEIENPKTVEALEWALRIFQTYDWAGPVDENGQTNWEYYKSQFMSGGAAFCPEQQYAASGSNNMFSETDFELGFVMFPAGPQGKLIQTAQDNCYVIPGCYDADRAWKIAFVYDLFNEYVPGYEDYNPFINSARTGNFDNRACEETIPMMGANATVELQSVVPGASNFMDQPFLWQIGPNTTATIGEIIDGMREIAKTTIEEANN